MVMNRFTTTLTVVSLLGIRALAMLTNKERLRLRSYTSGTTSTSASPPRQHLPRGCSSTTQRTGYCTTQTSLQVQQQEQHQQLQKRRLYSFTDARRMARNYQFDSQQEYLEYSCPGAYQLPKNPQDVWPTEWKGWDDWLGIRWDFHQGRILARALQFQNQQEYMEYIASKQQSKRSHHDQVIAKNDSEDDDPSSRLPYRPDLAYKSEWISWRDWLGISTSVENLEL